MTADHIVCLWFPEEDQALLVDRTNGSDSVPICVRLVYTNDVADRNIRRFSVWQPLASGAVPHLVGRIGRQSIEIFNWCTRFGGAGPTRTYFDLDDEVTIADADSWCLVGCASGTAVEPICAVAIVNRHAIHQVGATLDVRDVLAAAFRNSLELQTAATVIVVPLRRSKVGPAVMVKAAPPAQAPMLDFFFDERQDGTRQPVVTATVHDDHAIEQLNQIRIIFLRRDPTAADWVTVATLDGEGVADGRQLVFPGPVFHGDVIGIIGRGDVFALSPRLGVDVIESWGDLQVALFVRKEHDLSPARADEVLTASGVLDTLRDHVLGAAADADPHPLHPVRVHLAAVLRQAAVATSVLLSPRELARHGRAEITRFLASSDDLSALATYATSPTLQLKQLLDGGRLDVRPVASSTAGGQCPRVASIRDLACVANLDLAQAELDPSLVETWLKRISGRPEATEALVDPACRAFAREVLALGLSVPELDPP